MTKMITRTYKTFKAIAVDFDIVDGKPVAVEGANVEYKAASENDALARKAFKDAGIQQKRGTRFIHRLVKEETFGITEEQFLELAVLLKVNDGTEPLDVDNI